MAAAVIKTANKQYKLTDKQRDRVKKYYAPVLCDAYEKIFIVRVQKQDRYCKI